MQLQAQIKEVISFLLPTPDEEGIETSSESS